MTHLPRWKYLSSVNTYFSNTLAFRASLKIHLSLNITLFLCFELTHCDLVLHTSLTIGHCNLRNLRAHLSVTTHKWCWCRTGWLVCRHADHWRSFYRFATQLRWHLPSIYVVRLESTWAQTRSSSLLYVFLTKHEWFENLAVAARQVPRTNDRLTVVILGMVSLKDMRPHI